MRGVSELALRVQAWLFISIFFLTSQGLFAPHAQPLSGLCTLRYNNRPAGYFLFLNNRRCPTVHRTTAAILTTRQNLLGWKVGNQAAGYPACPANPSYQVV